jgi:drug/metabolite transporter (DMT)-like permease
MVTALILVFVAVCFSVTGELLLKQGMNLVGVLSLSTLSVTVPKMLRTWHLYAGLGSIAVGAVFWLAAISRVNLSWAYPMLAMGYVLVLVFSRLILHEHVSVVRWGGTLLIVIGVYLISRS